MPDGRIQILSPFTGRKKQKAWNKTREKYMPVKRRQNLDSKGALYNGNDSDNDENNEQQQLPEGFANSWYKIGSQILL